MWVGDGDGEAHGRKKMPAKRPGVSRLKERLSEAKPSGSSAFKAARPGGTRGGRQGVITKARPRLSTGGGMSAFANGEDVEARCKGSKKHYAGKIFMDNGDGTYDVKFDDGDRDRAVPQASIKKAGAAEKAEKSRFGGRSDEEAPVKLRMGDKVEARCKGSKKHYAGKIFMDNRDGTYDVKFDDGDRDRAVPEASIKTAAGAGSDSDDRRKPAAKLRTGDKVEARCKGSKKHYAGKIYADNRDGTYDVKFDDGDRDRAVPEGSVKAAIRSGTASVEEDSDAAASSSSSPKFREGDRVEAKSRGAKKFYAGTIARRNRDGTYDVKFDDGERDREVPARSVRAASRNSAGSEDRSDSDVAASSSSSPKFREGDRVEAKAKGTKRYASAKVRKANRDGTYDIKFDDGERQRAIPARSIRLAPESDPDSGSEAGSESEPDAKHKSRKRSSRKEESHARRSAPSSGDDAPAKGKSTADKSHSKKRGSAKRKQIAKSAKSPTPESDGDFSEWSEDDAALSHRAVSAKEPTKTASTLKDALKKAFAFYDDNGDGVIEKDELGNIMRAMGDDPTGTELDDIFEKADEDGNGRIDFREFHKLLKRRLQHVAEESGAGLGKASEAQMMEAFQGFDRDGNGQISIAEFRYGIKHVLEAKLTQAEMEALLDEVDRDGDGMVSYAEFVRMFKLLGKDASKHDRLSKDARSALEKTQRGVQNDPEEHLIAFLGMPSNFRPSVFAALCKHEQYRLQHALARLMAPDFSIGVGTDFQQERGVAQAIFSLKRGFGVPQPDDTRRSDIISRKVRVALFYDPAPRKSPSRDQQLVGNIHSCTAGWRPEEEDVWRFESSLTSTQDQKVLVRVDTDKFPLNGVRSISGEEDSKLYALFELSVVMKVRGHSRRKAKRGTKKRRGRKRRSKRSESDGSDSGDASSSQEDGSGDEESKDGAHAVSGKRQTEMSCGWCKIALDTVMQQRGSVRYSEVLQGGTPFAEVAIDKGQVSQRRTGWRKMLRTFKASPDPPTLVVKATPWNKASASSEERGGAEVLRGIDTVMMNFAALPLMRQFANLLKQGVEDGKTGSSPCYSLKLFTQILNDSDAHFALQRAWEETKSALGFGQRRNEDLVRDEFRKTVLSLWPAFHAGGQGMDNLAAMEPARRSLYFQELAQGNQQGPAMDSETLGPQLYAPFHIKEMAPTNTFTLGSAHPEHAAD